MVEYLLAIIITTRITITTITVTIIIIIIIIINPFVPDPA